MQQPIIRDFNFNDVPQILEIVNHYILNTTAVYDYKERTLAEQEAILKDKIDKNFPFLVAEMNNQIVGFGTYGSFRFKAAYLHTVEHSVYLRPKFEGFGLGKLLLNELISIAKKQKMRTMIAVIDSENQGSINFHEQFGFEIIGTIKDSGFKFNRWLHSVLMQVIFD